MHGSSDHFVGFAIDLSTFRNPDVFLFPPPPRKYYRFHKDISLYSSSSPDGSAYQPGAAHPGCYSNYRYFEGRQDFSVPF